MKLSWIMPIRSSIQSIKTTQLKKTSNKERRSDHDRRQEHISFYKLLLFEGKRRNLRRAEDCRRIPRLDHYHPTLLIYTLIVLGLSLLDATLTLVLIHRGAVELNPVMRYYLNLGPGIFITVKYGLTAFALLILVVLHTVISVRYRIVSSMLLPSCIAVFGAVIVWELYLLTKLSPV